MNSITLNKHTRLKREGVNLYHTSDPQAETITENDVIFTSDNVIEVSELHSAIDRIHSIATSHVKEVVITATSSITWDFNGDILIDGKGFYPNYGHTVELNIDLLNKLNIIRQWLRN